jgi:hypothetical protein
MAYGSLVGPVELCAVVREPGVSPVRTSPLGGVEEAFPGAYVGCAYAILVRSERFGMVHVG